MRFYCTCTPILNEIYVVEDTLFAINDLRFALYTYMTGYKSIAHLIILPSKQWLPIVLHYDSIATRLGAFAYYFITMYSANL